MRPIRKRFKLGGQDVFLCDMRPGFSEDGVMCSLPKGEYELVVEPSQSGNLRGFNLVLVGETPTKKQNRGSFTIDMARVGVFERAAFLSHFNGDGEAMFDWSATAADSKISSWGGFLRLKKSRVEALYVNIGADCKCSVHLLLSGKRTVGLRLIPQLQVAASVEERGSRSWTWVTVKCSGISDRWEFCDDRDYKTDLEDVLRSVVSEVCSGDSLTFQDAKTFNPDVPIAKYRRRFKGITHISVFAERSGENRKRVDFPRSYAVPKFGARATARELAQAIFKITTDARTWA